MTSVHEDAEKDYMAGMKYQEIADKYNVSINTVKSWKKRHGWDRKGGAPKLKKVCTQNKKVQPLECTHIDDGTKETLQNEKLTKERQMFCIYYSNDHNAVQSYIKAYNCSYTNACGHAHELLKKVDVRNEIDRLLEIKASAVRFNVNEFIEMQMRIAFADIGNYLSFGQKELIDPDTEREYMVSTVDLKESDKTDTQIIQEVKKGRDGVSVKLADKQKAIDWLTKFFLIHPDDKYKAEFDKKRAEVTDKSAETILENVKTIADLLQHPVDNRDIVNYE